MKSFQWLLGAILCLGFTSAYAQKATVSGKITDKTSKQPLEYATITFLKPGDTKPVAGGITDTKGEYSIEVAPGNYDIKFEFISFKSVVMQNYAVEKSVKLNTVELADDAQLLDAVVVRAEKTTVEIKLDKEVYNVGNDLMVKGGTVSDVLDNIPSVSVDQDGTISLRGNENVRILIDGKPSNAINITEALRIIPADAIDKVEVVTNPSARYDSEGGGGLLNIILKKGKNQGINGAILGTVGHPDNYGLSANLNFKTDKVNVFTTTGYSNKLSPGNSRTDTHYLDGSGYTNERRNNDRLQKGYNSNFGFDYFIDKSLTWTNAINLRHNTSANPEIVKYFNYDADHVFTESSQRFNDQQGKSDNFEYTSTLVKNFKKEGHKLTLNAAFSINEDRDNSSINDGYQITNNIQDQNRNVIQADYVLPLGKDSQFEAGFKGEYNRLLTDYYVGNLDTLTNTYNSDSRYSNKLEYKEKVNALYAQYGAKIQKFSYLLGLRWEDSNIDVNQLFSLDFNNKHYSNFFPSAFLTYELADQSSISLSYSRRISRPRGRMINPFSNYSSNINIFQGNPNLNPAFSDAFDLGYLKRWKKLTLSTSAYLNHTMGSFQMIRRQAGYQAEITPGGPLRDVILTTPVNLGDEYRFGFEFTFNYNPFKWWKINTNFNFFRNQTIGEYSYIADDTPVVVNLDNTAYSWSARMTSKVNLPYKIDWQTNFNYNAPQKNAQGRSLGVPSMNLGLSKDIFKDKATVAMNVQDVFNSRKRINETYLPGVQESYSEMQWRVRQITLSLTYRFNKAKTDRDDKRQRDNNNDGGGGGEDFPG